VTVGGRMGLGLGGSSLCSLVGAWLVRPRPDPERWRRGAAGEVATAAQLDRLPGRRWVVRHDLAIPGSRANLDHLVIGPSGVWLVDTKTTRAHIRTGWRRVYLGERRLDPGPTQWEAGVVADRLGVRVRPLIVLHGEGLRRRGGRCGSVRVVPVDAAVGYVRRRRRQLDRAEVVRLAARADSVFGAASGRSEKRAGVRG
jgi:hypothetical protein